MHICDLRRRRLGKYASVTVFRIPRLGKYASVTVFRIPPYSPRTRWRSPLWRVRTNIERRYGLGKKMSVFLGEKNEGLYQLMVKYACVIVFPYSRMEYRSFGNWCSALDHPPMPKAARTSLSFQIAVPRLTASTVKTPTALTPAVAVISTCRITRSACFRKSMVAFQCSITPLLTTGTAVEAMLASNAIPMIWSTSLVNGTGTRFPMRRGSSWKLARPARASLASLKAS